MKYEQPSFTLPTCATVISQTEWELRVGLRCPKCYERISDDTFQAVNKHQCKPAS